MESMAKLDEVADLALDSLRAYFACAERTEQAVQEARVVAEMSHLE